MKFGVQLYNFRKELAADFKGALKEISRLGFDGAEFAMNYGQIAPGELAAYTRELGLECAGTMFQPEELLDGASPAYEYARELKSPAVTISAFCDFAREWEKIAETCRKIGDNAAARGCVFSYHNHWAEFVDADGMSAMDRILAATDPRRVLVEPDVCWLTRGGVNPVDFLRRHASRIRQVHMKDSRLPEDKQQLTELGGGIVDLAGAFHAANEIGVSWLIYEQDVSADPFRSAEISLKFLKKLREGV